MSHGTSENAELRAALKDPNLPEVFEETASGTSIYTLPYSDDLGKRITNLYAEKSLAEIARLAGMPTYATILRWAKEHPEFSQMLRAVRDTRALHFENAAIEAAEKARGKDADRLKVETYKWAAEVNDPKTYSKKISNETSGGPQVVFNVITGYGPPNEYQTPPKLNPDGTIDKTPPKHVESEVVDDRPAADPEASVSASSEPRSSAESGSAQAD